MRCQKCQTEVFLPFRCQYCGGSFCSDHRLPENHECSRMEMARTRVEEAPPLKAQKQKPHEYTVTYVPVKQALRSIYFSRKEIKHLAIGALLVMGAGLSLALYPNVYREANEPIMIVMFTVILTGSFFIHEIAHKIAAQKRGLWAEFRLTLMGAVLTLFSVVSAYFKIISPGAVMIGGFAD